MRRSRRQIGLSANAANFDRSGTIVRLRALRGRGPLGPVQLILTNFATDGTPLLSTTKSM
jgi:hypothetical protein